MGGLLWALGCMLAQPKWAKLGAHTPPSFPKPWGAQGAATTIEKIKKKWINLN